MSGVEPTIIDKQGIKMISEDEEKSIILTMDGVEKGIILGYDNGTANPKNFSITSGGIEWSDASNNYTTSLERLSAVQIAFQSILEPPNATTLVVNKVINLDNGLGNVGSIGLDASNNLVINNVGGGSINSNAVQPLANDSSTKIPTTAWVQTAVVANIPTSIDITDNNTNATFFPVFTTGAGTGQSLFVDSLTTPFNFNPSNGTFNVVNTLKITSSNVSMGFQAGLISQGSNAVAIGVSAGTTSQGSQSVAIGRLAGNANQLTSCVAIGNVAGQTGQLASSVAIGNAAGNLNQRATAVAVGNSAGNSDQGTSGVAIGNSAGTTSQGASSVAIGVSAGNANQGATAVAIGSTSGTTGQGISSIAIGNGAGTTSQGASSVAIGLSAGTTSQLANSVAIGRLSGNANQGISSIAIGNGAGQTSQAGSAVAIGLSAGTTSQLANSVAIGILAGNANQATNAVAIGRNAGAVSQGASSVAIGYNAGGGSQVANSICLNASGIQVNPAAAGFFVNPVRNATGDELIQYNTTSKEITYSNTLTALPECSVVPINANQLVNKTFVNDVILEDFDAETNDNNIAGNKIVFNETGTGRYDYYLGNFSSEIINGTIGRRGILQLQSGNSSGNETMLRTNNIYSLANITKLTFGFIPLGRENFSTEGRIPVGNIYQILGLSATNQQTGEDTTQSVIWRLASGSGTIPTWEFVMNNVVQYTSVLGELTGKWCRVSLDITFDGVDYLVQSTLTNLTDGTTETSAVYPLTTGYVFTLNSIAPYMSSGTNVNTNKFLGVDYCELQQNLYNIGGGNTLDFR